MYGTEKQVIWAKDIQANLFRKIDEEIEALVETEWTGEAAELKKAKEILKLEVRAEKWIENRKMAPCQLVEWSEVIERCSTSIISLGKEEERRYAKR
jgi:tRNA A37 N6-isopentenylltransferase MiaA